MSIYNSAEYHFAQTDTDRDVDKQKETESEVMTGEGAGEEEWVHDRWAWVTSNLQSSCSMTTITHEP